jgi:transposase
LAAAFQPYPPATVTAAAARIAARTGIVRKPPQVRQFLRSLGMKPLKVGMSPAKADVGAQETVKKKAWSRA